MKKALIKLFVTISTILIISFPIQSYGKNTSILNEVRMYSQSVGQFEKGAGNKTLGEIYVNGLVLAEKLVDHMHKWSEESDVLESLSDEDYLFVQKEMKGFYVTRHEIVDVSPDMKFFNKMAIIGGAQEDKDFFYFMAEIYPYGIWPIFMQEQTPYSACDIYGDGVLTNLYIETESPKLKKITHVKYKEEISEIREGMKSRLSEDGGCACGGADTVIKELTLFIGSVPKANFIADVKRLLFVVKSGKSTIRLFCQTG